MTTRDDATQWELERNKLIVEIGSLQGLVRRQLREAWDSFRYVFPDQAHEMPWTSAGEKEIPKVTRDILTKIVEAWALEFHDDGTVGSMSAPKELRGLAKEAHDHLKDTEE